MKLTAVERLCIPRGEDADFVARNYGEDIGDIVKCRVRCFDRAAIFWRSFVGTSNPLLNLLTDR